MADMTAQLTFWSSSRSGFMSGAADIVVSAETDRAVVLDGSGQLLTHFDTKSAHLISVVSAPKKVSVLADCVHKKQPALACLHEDGSIVLCDPRDGASLLSNNTVLSGRTPQCATSVANTDLKLSYIIVGDTNCTLTVINSDTLACLHRTEVPPPGFTIGMVSCGAMLAAVLPDKTLRYWAVKEGDEGTASLEKAAVVSLPGKGIPVDISHHCSLPLTLVVSVTCCTVYRDAVQTTPIASIGLTDKTALDKDVQIVFSKGAFVPVEVTSASGALLIHIACISSSGAVHLYAMPELDRANLSSDRRGSFTLSAPQLVWAEQCVEAPLCWSLRYVPNADGGARLRVAGVGYPDEGRPVDSLSPVSVRDNIAARVADQQLFVFELGAEDCTAEKPQTLAEKMSRQKIRAAIEENQKTGAWGGGDSVLPPAQQQLTPSPSQMFQEREAEPCSDEIDFCSDFDSDVESDTESPQNTPKKAFANPSAKVTYSYLHIPASSAKADSMLTLFKGLCTGDVIFEDATTDSDGGMDKAIPSRGSWKAHGTSITRVLVSHGKLVTSCLSGEIKTWKWGEWNVNISTFVIHTVSPLSINSAPRSMLDRHRIELWTVGAEGTFAFMDSSSVLYSLCGNYHSPQDVNMEHSALLDTGNTQDAANSVVSAPSAAQLYAGVHYLKNTDYFVVVTANRLTAFVWHLGSETLLRTVKNEACTALATSLTDTVNYVDVCVVGGAEGMGNLGEKDECAYSDRTAFGAAVLRIQVSKLIESLYSVSGKGAGTDGRKLHFVRLSKMLLSYLLQGITHNSITQLRETLDLGDRPFPDGATLSFSDAKGIKLSTWMISPSKDSALHADEHITSYLFSTSPMVTSQTLVTLLALLHALCKTLEPHQVVIKAVINYFASGIPQTLRMQPHFFEADFFWCLQAIKDPLRDIQFAARCVINGVLKLIEDAELRKLSEELMVWKDPVASLGLAVVASQCTALLQEPTIGQQAAKGLLGLATCAVGEANSNLQNSALNHLGDTFHLWAALLPSTHVATFTEALKTLLLLATSQEVYTGTPQSTSRAAFRTLISCGFYHLSQFLQFADSVLTEVQAPKEDDNLPSQNCILHALSQMMKKQPGLFVPHLLRVALLLLKALDPHFIRLRDKCMVTSTQALKTAVEMFPMISFHQAKQSLAVGDVGGQTVVWDMKTGSKMFVWDAHSSQVSCMSFSTLGDMIATYSAKERALKIWSSEMPLLAILTSTHRPKLLASIHTPGVHVSNDLAAPDVHHMKIDWISPHNIELTTARNQSAMYEF